MLRHFMNEAGVLFVYDKMRPELGIKPLSPDNAFVRGHYFSEKDKSGNVDLTAEIRLGQIESAAAPVIKRIIDSVRCDEIPKFSNDDRRHFIRYIYFQLKRSPEWFQRISKDFQNKDAIEDFLHEFEQTRRPLTEAEKRDFEDPETLKRLNENVRARAMSSETEETENILSLLETKGIHFFRLPSRKSLIIGTSPLVRDFASGNPHLSERTTHLWVPLAHDIAVVFRGDDADIQIYGIKETSIIRAVNLSVFNQSDLVAARNLKLLESLISNR